MNAKIFIDSDVIIDFLAKRAPFYDDSAKIFALIHKKKIEAFTSAVVLSNVFYILRKICGIEEAKKTVKIVTVYG
jgi:predicted nucleic acid-binding protein